MLGCGTTHQPPKYYISRSTTAYSQFYPLQLLFAKDGLQRILALWSFFKYESKTYHDRQSVFNDIFRLLRGNVIGAVYWKLGSLQPLCEELRHLIIVTTKETVEGKLHKWYGDTLARHKQRHECVSYETPKNRISDHYMMRFLSHCLQNLSSLCCQLSSAITL